METPKQVLLSHQKHMAVHYYQLNYFTSFTIKVSFLHNVTQMRKVKGDVIPMMAYM